MANPAVTKHINHRTLLSIELLLHLLTAGLLYLSISQVITKSQLTLGASILLGMVFIRLLSVTSGWKSANNRNRNDRKTDWPGSLSALLLAVFWGGLPYLLSQQSSVPDSSYILASIGIMGTAIAIFSGSALSTNHLMKFSAVAFGISISWALQSKHLDVAILDVFLLILASSLAMAVNNIDNILDRFSQISKGNSELVRNLASTRDEALQAKARAEKTNEKIKAEIIERKKAERKIKLSEMELNRILNDMTDTYFRFEASGTVNRISPSIEKMLGYTPKVAGKMRWQDFFFNHSDYEKFMRSIQMGHQILQGYEVRFKHKDGSTVWVSLNVHRHQDLKNGNDGYEGMARNTTEKRHAKEALYKEKELWRVALESIADGIITTDINGDVTYLNPVAEQITGWKRGEASNKPVREIMKLVNEATSETVELPVDNWMVQGERASLQEHASLIGKDSDNITSIELTGAPIRDSRARIIGSVMVFHDVTKLRALTNELSYQATHDTLTGLINRLEFDNLLESAISSSESDDEQHAVMFIDLDKFKIVNDTSGHPAGDELLIQITRLFESVLRDSDKLARLGGDEFGVLLNNCDLKKAEEIAETLRQATEDFRFAWEDKVFRIGASVGIAAIAGKNQSLTDLLKEVDSACYIAKENGRNCVHVSHPKDTAVANRRGQMQWMQRLQSALDDDGFILYAQPIKPIKEGLPDQKRVELLIRMLDTFSDEPHKVISPSAFLPVAERYHLMPAIDQWVISTAFNRIATGSSIVDMATICSINLSGQSLSDMKTFRFIDHQFEKTSISPASICFEITESAMIANMEIAQEILSRLKAMGCSLALDDFGTGLSSFDYLRQLPVDYVKLDKILVRDVATSETSRAMVFAVNHVASVMGMKSIAEYVETDEIKDILRELSVDYAQGFGIGEPVPFYLPKNINTDVCTDQSTNTFETA
ncbi:MAG: EAL domain-containing protein [Gammaproteobacteria bacterium]